MWTHIALSNRGAGSSLVAVGCAITGRVTGTILGIRSLGSHPARSIVVAWIDRFIRWSLRVVRTKTFSWLIMNLRAVAIALGGLICPPGVGIYNAFQFRMTWNACSGFFDEAFSHFQPPLKAVAVSVYKLADH